MYVKLNKNVVLSFNREIKTLQMRLSEWFYVNVPANGTFLVDKLDEWTQANFIKNEFSSRSPYFQKLIGFVRVSTLITLGEWICKG